MGDIHPLLPDDPEQVGGYALVGRLGEGPRGVTYLGRPSPEAAASVVKVMHARPSADAEARDRLVQELSAAKGLSGSHAVPPIEAGWVGDQPYVVRGYVKGASLHETVRDGGPLEADALERLALGTLTALTAVHAAGLVHRGLTPDNILIGSDGPRVSDIGMGEAVGAYRAPEQIRGEPGDARSDLFSWAASIAYAATGHAPGASAPAADTPSDPAEDGGPSPEMTVNVRGIAAAIAAGRAGGTSGGTATGAPGDAAGGAGGDRPAGDVPALDGVPQPLRRVVLACLSPDPAARPTARNAMLRLLGEDDAAAPSADVAVPAAPLPGAPVAGVVLPAQQHGPQPFPRPEGGQPWGPPPPPGSASPAPGPHGNPMAAPGQVWQGPPQQQLPPAAPAWGAPPMPNQAPPVQGTVGGPGRQDQRAPLRKGPSLGLAASLAAVLALSVGGVWAAGHYADTKSFDRAAAEGAAEGKHSMAASPADTIPSVGTTGKPQQPQTQVTVPWATTPEPEATGVFPLTLPTDWVSENPTPDVVTVPTIPNIPMSPPPVPITQPTTQRTTEKPTAAPSPTRSHRGRPNRTPSPTPTATPIETQEPAPDPTTPAPTHIVTRRPDPTPTKTVAPPPTPTKTVAPPPTRKPDPTPTKTAPPPTPTKTVAPPPTKAPEPPAQKPAPQPARNPYTPEQVCNSGGHGSGYYVQRSAGFNGGTVYQLYSNSSGYNCVVAMKTADVGKATQVWAKLEIQGGGSSSDGGAFQYYAGPVMLSGKGKCVRFSGGGDGGSTGGDWANCG
ncbi:serine/threonine protein kinase [Microtetraspora sp. NBRC 16547]|uniref:serine/threonine-protein kinase n=1 Tax=Microtetraspora sp. NBRC 16547 TaxID=3030993 RepID=UPI0024A2BE77|nr:serine/threonine protein kinase [Microtetraspora sp. NBRC 16547]GLW96139.1 hypothetical protein Misp02_02260 [Microtetraspora sp. NBRC 16547]